MYLIFFDATHYIHPCIIGLFSDTFPGFCECLIFSKYGFATFRILLATKSEQRSQQAANGV